MSLSSKVAPDLSGAESRRGDDFTRLYEQHFAFVWRTLGYLGLDGSAQEDAAQEVFVVVHKRLSDFESRSQIRTWLYAIARNMARNFRRGDRRRGDLGDIPADFPWSGPSPEETYGRREALGFVHEFLDSLDETKREVFVLCELEQLSALEASEILKVSPNTIASRLRLGRKAFAEAASTYRGKEGLK